jgi:hypothetical protein
MTPAPAPEMAEIVDVFRKRFGIGLEQGLKRLEQLAGNAIFFDNWIKTGDGGEWDNPIGLPLEMRGGVRMEDRDFAILAFFAGVGRMVLLEHIPAQALPPAPERPALRAPETDGCAGRVEGGRK